MHLWPPPRFLQAYSVTGAVGTGIAVLGGVVTWVGGSCTSVMGMQAQYGAGVMIFVGTEGACMR